MAAAAVRRYTTMLHANKSETAPSTHPGQDEQLNMQESKGGWAEDVARGKASTPKDTNQHPAGTKVLPKLTLVLESQNDAFTNWTMDESYAIVVEGSTAVATAATPVGGLRVRFPTLL